MSNISHERSAPTGERSSATAMSQMHTRGIPLTQSNVAQSSNSANSTASTTFSLPSPPPPAPLSSLHGQPLHPTDSSGEQSIRETRAQEASTPAYVNYTAPRNAAPLSAVPWPAASNASMDPSMLYSLERIHSASMALCNSVAEYLSAQDHIPRPDELYELLPIVSEINQEVRTLTSSQEGRAGRDYMEVSPYYPWLPGSSTYTAPAYWSPNTRDEREPKSMRMDDGEFIQTNQAGKSSQVQRCSPSVRDKSDRAMQRGFRVSAGAEEHGLTGRYGSEHTTISPADGSRADLYASYSVRTSKGSLNDMNNSQQTYVPKYKKRSRAPAPGVCHSCGNSDTPEWRRGPDGARTLCNACGLHFAKLVRRRTLEYASAAPGVPIPPVTIAELRQSTNVNTNAPAVVQADGERARIVSEAAASTPLSTTTEVTTGSHEAEDSSNMSHMRPYHEKRSQVSSKVGHQDAPLS